MRNRLAIVIFCCWAPVTCIAQKLPEPKPSVQGFLFLPVALKNPVFDDLTAVLGQLEGVFQMPVWKGLGVGLGVNATWYELEERAVGGGIITQGEVRRMLYFGKLNWTRYTGPRTFYELNTKLGQSTWTWDCTTCASNETSSSFHWGVNAAYFIHASDNLAFGLSLGYEADAAEFGPEVIGLERFPGRTDASAPYRFITIGLGFSTTFANSSGSMW